MGSGLKTKILGPQDFQVHRSHIFNNGFVLPLFFSLCFSLRQTPVQCTPGENPLEIEIPSPAMAFAPSINASFSAQLHSWVPKKCLFLCIDHEPANLKFSLPRTRPSRASSALAFGRRRKDDAPVAKKKKKGRNKVNSMSSLLVY